MLKLGRLYRSCNSFAISSSKSFIQNTMQMRNNNTNFIFNISNNTINQEKSVLSSISSKSYATLQDTFTIASDVDKIKYQIADIEEYDSDQEKKFQELKLQLLDLEDSILKDSIKHKIMGEGEAYLYKYQSLLEFKAIEESIHKYRDLVDTAKNSQFKSAGMRPIRTIMMQWSEQLIAAVKEEYKTLRDEKESWVNILLSVPAEKSAMIALNHVIAATLHNKGSISNMAKIKSTIGVAIYAEHKVKNTKLYPDVSDYNLKNLKSKKNVTFKDISQTFAPDILSVSAEPVEKIGNFLIDIILKSCTVKKNLESEELSDMVPAFCIDNVYQSGRKLYMLRGHINVIKIIDDGFKLQETAATRLLPMVVKPIPWTSPDQGAYLHYRSILMRTYGSKSQLASLFQSDLSHIFKGLNVLGEVPWVINKKVYKIVLDCWENGGGVADIPSRKDLELPALPDDYATNILTRKAFSKQEAKIKKENYDMHSLRCDTILKLDVASKFLDNTIYFPHNVDFRGRSYPIPPHLNHLGSDFCRSLLKFEKKLPLGANGYKWLKIHIANLYGADKIPFEDRVAFTENNIDNIRESVENLFNGSRWWLKADNPWQFISACVELCDAIDSGNPETFESNLPIHQDGTCNGLQHYAALGGDTLGAYKVNLLPSDRPQDVYSSIAQIVNKRLEKEAEEGVELAKIFLNKIDRKIVKQTVMTSVYGVTFIGAKEQILNAMKEKFKDMEEELVFKGSTFIAKHTFGSLDQMFLGARAIMAWFGKCAHLIAKSGECVSWVTPLGLPIIQPYRKGGNYKIKTLESDYIIISDSEKLPVDSMKQKSAFPPNFIHSLDSTHMFLTALTCKEKGITYSSVHDSYWTHGATVDQMNEILRNEFIELHSQPLLQRLLDWFKLKHPNIDFPPLPTKGDLNLNEIKNSKYFFH